MTARFAWRPFNAPGSLSAHSVIGVAPTTKPLLQWQGPNVVKPQQGHSSKRKRTFTDTFRLAS